jgi:hypothetical protein
MSLPAGILKAALNNICKLLDNNKIVEILYTEDKFNPQEILVVLQKHELIDRFSEAELEEVILLTI